MRLWRWRYGGEEGGGQVRAWERGVWEYLDYHAMRDRDVERLIARYLARTGNLRGAEALWQAHVAWRRANGMMPARGEWALEVHHAGGDRGALPRDRDLGGRGGRQG